MERPIGVTILGVLGYIGAGCLVLAALVMFLSGAMVANLTARPGFGGLAAIGGVLLGVFFLAFAAFYVATAVGLMKLRNWARILVIIICAVGVCFYAVGLLSALFHLQPVLVLWRAVVLVVDLWVGLYLLKPHVKQAFGATGF
jgi:hypothetical protein